ncbi:MAG: glycerate kinase [Verrucomicrobia bacterium]|nr:glycerate kinase [Verrucomicrobiota bacterium]
MNVLIAPDKFKGTLSARAAAEAIAAGWQTSRPGDALTLLPISDGGDGFGEILSGVFQARPQCLRTVDAAHRPLEATWWWEPKSKTAIIESANIIGLALLPPGKFYPFQLDTFGLGAALRAAAQKGARRCFIGIGGSATNDGGFGLARALGWKFLDRQGDEITKWPQLAALARILPPRHRKLFPELIVAVDVQNKLLGARGCARIYGPQKGLRPEDFPAAERALRTMARLMARELGRDFAREPGAGAAGGLGFGLAAFAGGRLQSGFDLIARHAKLDSHLRGADLVITGEGALDRSSLMGKGPGEIARRCRAQKIPCLGLGGVTNDLPLLQKWFARTGALVSLTTPDEAKAQPARWLKELSRRVATECAPSL